MFEVTDKEQGAQRVTRLTQAQVINGVESLRSHVTSFCEELCDNSVKMDERQGVSVYLDSAISDIMNMINPDVSREEFCGRIDQKYPGERLRQYRDKFMGVFDLAHGIPQDKDELFRQVIELSTAENCQLSEDEYEEEIRDFLKIHTSAAIKRYVRQSHPRFIKPQEEDRGQEEKLQVCKPQGSPLQTQNERSQ
jgi:hypothetical protein